MTCNGDEKPISHLARGKAIARGVFFVILVISSLVIGAFTQTPLVSASRWSRQTVQAKDNVGYYPSLALDAGGIPHVAYVDISNGALKYASKPAALWLMKTVDSTGLIGQGPSIALDSYGNPHISYYDGVGKRLKYARWTGVDWDIQVVDSAADVGKFSSLVLNSTSGEPHISYYDSTNGNLKYASWNGQVWRIQVVDSNGNVGGNTSLALDQSGYPCICYDSITANTVKFARYNGASWSVETVGSASSSQGSLSLDVNGNLYITYYVPFTPTDGMHAGLNFIEKRDSTWSAPLTIDGGGWRGIDSSLKIDAATNRIHVSYYTAATGDLRYAVRNGGSWTASTIDTGGTLDANVGEFSSLVLDSAGNPRVAYLDETNGALKFWNQTGTVQSSTVADSGGVGSASSLVLDQSGSPHISYVDVSHGALKYAEKTPSGWTYVTVDTVGDLGIGTSLALDSNGSPHIAYYDRAINGDLKYALRNGTQWTISIVDSAGNVGSYPSIKLDAADRPCISYYDLSNGDLKYAACKDNSWTISVVDTVDNVGLGASLSLDSRTKYPSISYYDVTNHNLKYASWNGTNWSIQVVDSVGNVAQGQVTSVVLDPVSDSPQISYYQAANQDLKYARWNGSQWIAQTVDSAGNVGAFSSIASDSSGKPRITYIDNTNGNLKYAAWDGANWVFEIVDSVFGVGQQSSLKLDTNGNPHISYYDLTVGSLLYAEIAGPKVNLPSVFVGVDVAYSNPSEFKRMVNDVSDYSNLLIVGYTLPASNLNEICQDAVNQGSSFMVYTAQDDYVSWAQTALQKWGNNFVAQYHNDEVGGETIDGFGWIFGQDMGVQPKNYVEAAANFQRNVGQMLSTVKGTISAPTVTSDYALYWFDYKAGYDIVLSQFGWNNDRQLNIALCRGAATVQNKNWGAIITWTYNDPPYIESGPQLYQDMVLAYDNGARYITVFDSNADYTHTILGQEHLQAMSQFWQYAQSNPSKSIPVSQRVAFVLPQNYALSFRWKGEKIWGTFDADNVSTTLYDNVVGMLLQYGNKLDIIYDDGLQPGSDYGYSKLIYWNDNTASPPSSTPSPTSLAGQPTNSPASTQTPSTSTSPLPTTNPTLPIAPPTSQPTLTPTAKPSAWPTTQSTQNASNSPQPTHPVSSDYITTLEIAAGIAIALAVGLVVTKLSLKKKRIIR